MTMASRIVARSALEVRTMDWDLGSFGLLLLLGMSLGLGRIAQLVAGQQTTRWLWLVVTAVYFVSGLFISEIWFGWATEEELQPNIDGLSFDEVLLGVIAAIATVLILRHMTRRHRRHRPRVAQ
jgi:hypothetical protein